MKSTHAKSTTTLMQIFLSLFGQNRHPQDCNFDPKNKKEPKSFDRSFSAPKNSRPNYQSFFIKNKQMALKQDFKRCPVSLLLSTHLTNRFLRRPIRRSQMKVWERSRTNRRPTRGKTPPRPWATCSVVSSAAAAAKSRLCFIETRSHKG